MERIKTAVGLISGGLDSAIAVHILLKHGFKVTGIYVRTPFLCGFGEKTLLNLRKMSEESGFDLRIIDTDDDYIRLLKTPVYGYGKNLNPCVDCHIYMLRKAALVMEEILADLVFTGEVINQRGKSQTRRSLETVERESGLSGRLLRPLSAGLLPATIPEEKGLLDRNMMLSIEGRTRTEQLAYAESYDIRHFSPPAGGCLLTEKGFCIRLKDLFRYKPEAKTDDYLLLQIGRHFRISHETKLIIPRNEVENMKISDLACSGKIMLFCKDAPGIKAILDGNLADIAIDIFATYSGWGDIIVYPAGNPSSMRVMKGRPCSKEKYTGYML